MTRYILGWVVLTLGLAAITSGLAMGYMVSVIREAEAENARANARMNPFPMEMELPRKSAMQEYGPAGVSVIAGLVLTIVGVNMRAVGWDTKRKVELTESAKKTCTACGGLSPEIAMKCYHCGKGFPAV